MANKHNTTNRDLQSAILSLETIPQHGINLRDDYIRLSNDYELFIQSFIAAVNEEQNLLSTLGDSEEISAEQLKEIYSLSDNRFSSVQDRYNNISKAFKDFKEKNLD